MTRSSGWDWRLRGSSIAETAEGEPVGMWRLGYDWDSAAIFVHYAKELDP
jgi:hypothetical protein